MTSTSTGTATIRPYCDTVTGDIRCWQIVQNGEVVADGIATEQDAKDRVRTA